MTEHDEQAETMPEPLRRRLKAHDSRVSVITSRVDRDIRAQAAAQFAGRQTRRRRPPAWAALAATVVLGLFIARFWIAPGVEEPATLADVDGSGRIDIADVLAAARASGKNAVSQSELDAFAMRIVALQPATGSKGDAS